MARIEVGKKYLTREKNTVKIVERFMADDEDGVPTVWFNGSFEKSVRGSENLLLPPNNVARFTADGAWQPRSAAKLTRSVHDLIEELK